MQRVAVTAPWPLMLVGHTLALDRVLADMAPRGRMRESLESARDAYLAELHAAVDTLLVEAGYDRRRCTDPTPALEMAPDGGVEVFFTWQPAAGGRQVLPSIADAAAAPRGPQAVPAVLVAHIQAAAGERFSVPVHDDRARFLYAVDQMLVSELREASRTAGRAVRPRAPRDAAGASAPSVAAICEPTSSSAPGSFCDQSAAAVVARVVAEASTAAERLPRLARPAAVTAHIGRCQHMIDGYLRRALRNAAPPSLRETLVSVQIAWEGLDAAPAT